MGRPWALHAIALGLLSQGASSRSFQPDDASGLVQIKLERQASTWTQEVDDQWAELKELVITVYAKMTSNQGNCPQCAETGFEVMCRGKSMKFFFKPSTNMARIPGKFPRQNIGWSPAKGVYHNLTVVLRRSGNHTFMIMDGLNPVLTWRKDFQRPLMFPRDEYEINSCRYVTARRGKDLSEGEKRCYRVGKFSQSHCLQMPASPVLRNRDAPYQGRYPDLRGAFKHCSVQGDPHYRTFGGLRYDYQGNGTYIFSSVTSDDITMTAQVFQCPVPNTMARSIRVTQPVAVAVMVGGHVVTYFNETTKVDGIVRENGIFHSATLNMDVSERTVVVESPVAPSGGFGQIRISQRDIKRSAVGYTLNVVAQLPIAEWKNSTGLCREKDNGPAQFVPRDSMANLFTAEELATMEAACCPGEGCNGPNNDGIVDPMPALEELCAMADPPIELIHAKNNCSECEVPEQCALDFCASNGDPAAVLDCGQLEYDTDIPEEPVFMPGVARAVDDPHCRNVRGEAFDVHAIGLLNFIAVPFATDTPGSDLSVKAYIEPVKDDICAPTVITRLDITGAWLDMPEPLIIRPGDDGIPAVPKAWELWMESPLATGGTMSLRYIKWRQGTMTTLVLAFGSLKMEMHQRVGKHTGVHYLDIEAKGLDSLEVAAGGLLGLGDHKFESQLRAGCDPHRKPIQLVRFDDEIQDSRTEGSDGEGPLDPEFEDSGRLLSMARAS